MYAHLNSMESPQISETPACPAGPADVERGDEKKR